MSRDSLFRFRGRFADLTTADKTRIVDRTSVAGTDLRETVAAIISDVRDRGDLALRAMAKQFDGVDVDSIEVPPARLDDALKNISASLRDAMERSARNISAFHKSQLPVESLITIEPGIVLGRRPDPLESVGVYAPGGRAAYPSSVLMGAIPARVAGVPNVVLCSPPTARGYPDDSILAAARIAGVDRVFAVGGAGAIAAMCIGTRTIPRSNKVVGPGNAYVAEAKLQMATTAAFDSPAGPSELLVIADKTSSSQVVAREVLAQAEHDPEAIVLVIVIAESAEEFEKAIESAIPFSPRREIIVESLSTRGGVITVSSSEEAVSVSNAFAPEHLLIVTKKPNELFAKVRNAGTVFLGESSSVSFGDYMTGANHVLPTAGLARSYSGLSTLDFVRWTTFQTVSPEAARSMSRDVATFADAEGLFAHGAAAAAWAKA
jgi:histidinol dehydrogenase